MVRFSIRNHHWKAKHFYIMKICEIFLSWILPVLQYFTNIERILPNTKSTYWHQLVRNHRNFIIIWQLVGHHTSKTVVMLMISKVLKTLIKFKRSNFKFNMRCIFRELGLPRGVSFVRNPQQLLTGSISLEACKCLTKLLIYWGSPCSIVIFFRKVYIYVHLFGEGRIFLVVLLKCYWSVVYVYCRCIITNSTIVMSTSLSINIDTFDMKDGIINNTL